MSGEIRSSNDLPGEDLQLKAPLAADQIAAPGLEGLVEAPQDTGASSLGETIPDFLGRLGITERDADW